MPGDDAEGEDDEEEFLDSPRVKRQQTKTVKKEVRFKPIKKEEDGADGPQIKKEVKVKKEDSGRRVIDLKKNKQDE